ncbi:PQQ-dependent sugar dehydrogenase [Arundinibacter roseus]|uniref:Glucose sorbosone dehydrogenase n=1 Tax=Arundinibacter roseus TaxID=2070510 RepID=A0A4R4KKS0_9BACT|nr:PQQ-dependent sugar dehydrogenase [Arundinibacter roseus]TDB68877.1 glucose sorbosone dehydrogenase [Arundinibacter roseus]
MTYLIKTGAIWAALVALIACGNNAPEDTTPTPTGPAQFSVQEAFQGLSFRDPVELVHAEDGSNRLFVIEQRGLIRSFSTTQSNPSANTFLDISGKVQSGGEMGLLGLAFHPDFKNNGYFFVNYTRDNPRESVIARYQVSNPATGVADPQSETILFTYAQPFGNHNGGSVHFGPDGFLYIATGDGGSGGDPQNNSQNRKNLLGKILRVDVNSTAKGAYGIPSDNPFAGNQEQFREEIYAYGLRNPWKISFDKTQNQLWAADVGQNETEEIDLIVKGGNYGWRLKEGDDCYNPSSNCEQPGLIDPVWEYAQSNGDRSVTGGYVYRGALTPDLTGRYIYGDFVSGRIWALDPQADGANRNVLLVEKVGSISTFGVDEKNELYFCNYQDGKIYRIVKK